MSDLLFVVSNSDNGISDDLLPKARNRNGPWVLRHQLPVVPADELNKYAHSDIYIAETGDNDTARIIMKAVWWGSEALRQWTVDCVEHVLPYYTSVNKYDFRPYQMLYTLRCGGWMIEPHHSTLSMFAEELTKDGNDVSDWSCGDDSGVHLKVAAKLAGKAVGETVLWVLGGTRRNGDSPARYAVLAAWFAAGRSPNSAALERRWQSARLVQYLSNMPD